MKLRSLSHLGNQELLRDLAALVARDRGTTAELLAHLAEVDDRRLYAQQSQPSMYAYCVEVLHMSGDTACKRIQAARTARQFPAILEAVADGRLHLSAVVVLAPYLTPDTADELLNAAAHKTRAAIEWMLAERFPRPDLPERADVPWPESGSRLSLGSAAGHVQELPKSSAPGRIASSSSRPKVIPLSAERVGLQTTIAVGAYENLRYAQALLGHTQAAGDLARVIERATVALVRELEKQKFAATSRPRASAGSSSNPRYLPAHVKRAVWERDGGQCGFVSEAGRRCPSRSRLEFDHVDPVARGGEATVDGIRLRCRTHNQYEAECVFGAGFMSEKRETALRAAALRRAEREGKAAERQAERQAARERAAAERAAEREAEREAEARARAAAADPEKDVTPWLRQLGVRGEQARRIAASCETLPAESSLEERVRFAVRQLAPPHRHVPASAMTAARRGGAEEGDAGVSRGCGSGLPAPAPRA